MTPSLRRIGRTASPLVVIDDFADDLGGIVDLAAALAPFGRARGSLYPGLRRVLGEGDAAWRYVTAAMRAAAPFVAGAFDAYGFDLIEASFSIVTDPPERLVAAQRAPHFDSSDPDYLALLHYLGGVDASGTAFFRQRSTGIERVDPASERAFVVAARREGGGAGYIAGSDARFEEIARVEAVPNRLLIYQGALLHSGLIPPGRPLSADPRTGRLTANFFVRLRRPA